MKVKGGWTVFQAFLATVGRLVSLWSTCLATPSDHASSKPSARTSWKLQPGPSGNIKPTPSPPSPREPPSPPTVARSRVDVLGTIQSALVLGRVKHTLARSSPTPPRTRASATNGLWITGRCSLVPFSLTPSYEPWMLPLPPSVPPGSALHTATTRAPRACFALLSCTYTHLLHAHFSVNSACTVTFAHFSCVSHTRMAQAQVVSKRCLLHMYHTSSSCLVHLMFHPSLLFLCIRFDIPCQSTILPYFPVLKAQDMRPSALASRSLAIWPSQMQTHERQHDFQGWDTPYVHDTVDVRAPEACTTALGSAFGSREHIDARAWESARASDEMRSAIGSVDHAPTEMVLTRQCADVSKHMYHMRIGGDMLDQDLLVAFDGQLRASVSASLNGDLPDHSW